VRLDESSRHMNPPAGGALHYRGDSVRYSSLSFLIRGLSTGSVLTLPRSRVAGSDEWATSGSHCKRLGITGSLKRLQFTGPFKCALPTFRTRGIRKFNPAF